jgi:hypothetical protein
MMTSLKRFSLALFLQVPVRKVPEFQFGSRPTILNKMFIALLSHSIKCLRLHGSCQSSTTLIQVRMLECSRAFAVDPGQEVSICAWKREL